MSPQWIDDDTSLDLAIDEILGEDRYAIDTEFHREKTYYPQLALVQIAWASRIALIDVLAITPQKLARLFNSQVLAVVHAAQQDLEVLQHACGAAPQRIFDTQLSAGFLGYSTPSLASLVQSEFKVALPKTDRLTDWLRRPLTKDQIVYAASDVEYLFEMHSRFTQRLVELGREIWAADACEDLRLRQSGPTDPLQAWLKIKEARSLRGRSRGVAQAVAQWRELKAMSADIPVRRVLSDMALMAIAQKMPDTEAELLQARGVEARQVGGSVAREIVAAVIDGRGREVRLAVSEFEDVERDLRPAITLISAWVAELARKNSIDISLLCTRSDINALLRGQNDARLAHGWRAQILGDDIKRIISGHAGLSFDIKGGLRILDTTPEASTNPTGDATSGTVSQTPN